MRACSLLQLTTVARAVSGLSQEPGILSMSPRRWKYPSPWAAFHCFPWLFSSELARNYKKPALEQVLWYGMSKLQVQLSCFAITLVSTLRFTLVLTIACFRSCVCILLYRHTMVDTDLIQDRSNACSETDWWIYWVQETHIIEKTGQTVQKPKYSQPGRGLGVSCRLEVPLLGQSLKLICRWNSSVLLGRTFLMIQSEPSRFYVESLLKSLIGDYNCIT